MIREIVKDTFFLSQKSELATRQDLPVVQDLLDTICANADRCVGMAANMIGVKKNIIVVAVGPFQFAMVNPVITKKSGESFQTVLRDRRKLSVADGTASGQTVQCDRGRISGSKVQTEKADIPGF